MNTFTGCLEDTRLEEEKNKDWVKILAEGAVEWNTKGFEDVKTFPVRNQDGSSSCVAQSLALMMGIENYFEEEKFIEFSAKDIYTRRTNQGGGMWGIDAFNIAKKHGATLEVLIPSQNQTEAQINQIQRNTSDEEIGKIFTIKDYYQLPFSLNQIAQIMENRRNGYAKPVMVWFRFPRAEWNSIPQMTNSSHDIVHHSVVAVDYGILNGKRGLFIQDSWGLHSSTTNGLRFISEDYMPRMTFCAYMNDKPNNWQGSPEKFVFNRVLRKGMRGEDVKELQKLLDINSDGIFGNQTFNAVRIFQGNNNLTVDGIVGRKTIEKLQ